MKYVVNQSDYTVDTLRNVTEYLSLAKTINVAQVFLPSDVMNEIDELNVGLNTAADTVADKTSLNSRKIRKVFTVMYVSSTCSFRPSSCSFMMSKKLTYFCECRRSALITVAAIMLLLALIGLCM